MSEPSVDPGAVVAGAGIGVVVIGRNEGERLRRCLHSVIDRTTVVVYVDSGSDDGSPALAEAFGAHVVMLDRDRPYTAARARNAGVRRLLALEPDVRLVQFVDGDCEMAASWIACASSFLARREDVAAVCGRRRERYPNRSVYNLLCDLEWNTPVGPANACGGDVMIRSDTFQEVAGFRDDLIAGEEPELCVRLRAKGWLIWRLDEEMTLHDAAMTRFGQWWKRAMRAGYAFAEGAALHGAPPERHWVRESRSALAWGIGLPVLLLACAIVVGPWALVGAAVYPLQVLRLVVRDTGPPRIRLVRATFLVMAKFAEAAGQLTYFARRARGAQGALIEYK